MHHVLREYFKVNRLTDFVPEGTFNEKHPTTSNETDQKLALLFFENVKTSWKLSREFNNIMNLIKKKGLEDHLFDIGNDNVDVLELIARPSFYQPVDDAVDALAQK